MVSSAPADAAESTPSALVAGAGAPTPAAPLAMPALPPSPTHRVLEWLVDVIAHRKGEVSRDEMAEYCDAGFLGPVAGTAESFRRWASAADGAVLESLEIDDPTYVRGYLATQEHRWKLTFEIDQTSKMSYLRFETVR